jgi:hypothetical protein
VVSGTGTVTFGDATATNTTARFSQAGTYVLRLTASDSLAATSSDIVITVQSVAKNPTVTIVTPTDGAQFSLGQAIPIQITTTSGGGAVTNITVWDNDVMLAQTNAPEFALTWTNGSVDGHVLSAAAMDDNGYTSVTSSITVFIVSTNESGFVVDAGADQVIEFSQSAALSGSLDFLDAPVDGQTNVLWRKVSGPDNVQFSDASALNASASFGSPGSYTLQLSVSYNGSVENDTLVVTVLPMPAKKLIAPRSTKGADIWMTFLYQSITTSGDDPNFNTVVLAADTDAEVQLEYSVYPGYDNGYIQTNYLHVTGGQTLSVPLTLGFGYDDLLNNLVTTNAVHISANVPVTAYGFTRDSWSADGYQALPTAMLGTNYIVLSYAGYYSTFALLATEDNTHVTVTPTVDIDGWSAGETRELVLQRGQTYRTQKSSQISGIVDFTGTTIVSDKPVAVYGGDTIAFVPTNCPWGDFLIEQMPPVNIWGQHFATMPLDGRSGGDTFRCLASQDGTQVSINGKVMATLGHGQFYEQIIDGPSIILATKPILVAQYANGSTYDGMLGDPFMMLIVPVEQYGGNCLLDALSLVGSRHYWEDPGWNTVDGVDYISYMNLIVYGQGTNDVWLDGQSVSADLFQKIGGSEYYGAQVAISNGTHSVSSAFPIQACVYGWSYTESYAYSSGFNTDIMEDDTQVALTQTTAYAVVGQKKTAMAKVTNGRGLPIADVEVPFRVLGTNQADAWIRTARNGIARFTYTGTNSGIDIISVNLGSLTNSVTNTWLMPGGNQTPMVFTTNTQPVQAGLNIQLMGTVIDDGLPAGAPLKVRWQLLDGPGDVTFKNPDQVRTGAACTKPGTYLFELTADDTQFSRSAVVSVVADYAPEITFPTTDIPSVVVVGSSVQLSARAGDANGLVVKVEFYANDQLIGTVTNEATGWQGFNLNWVPAQNGVMDLYAIAYDDVGVSSTSSVVTVESDTPPAVAIDNLTGGNVVFVPTNVPIHAVASDLDGVVTNLSIYVNGELLGTATNGELMAFWQPCRAGDYTLSAVASDEWGISTTSDNITVTVAGVFPVVTITNPVPNTYWGGYSTPIGKPITLGADVFIDSPYLITNVSFYARGSLIGSMTMPPYSLVWTPRSGYSTITVQAEAESGAIGEATIGVDAYLDASVSLVEPVNNQVVYVGQPVRFKLAERDPWNVLENEIYNYYVNWGLVATAPASKVVYWTPSQPGNYTIEPYGVIGYAIYTYVNLIAINPPIQNVGIVSPADGDVLYASVQNPVQVSFDDATNAFDHLEVFADGVSLGQTTNTLFNWVPPLNGSYVLSARVYDHAGHAFDATNTVSVQVTAAPRPVVTIDSPVDGSRVRANAETVVAASLNDPAGIATNVQFYLDGALASQNSVYFVWTPTVLGAHSLQCIAFTADGDSITSAPVNVTVAVMNPPTVSILTPTNGQYFVAGSQPLFSAVANDSDGLVTNLVLTLDSMVVGGTNGGVLQVSTNLTPGWHDLAAQATDNDGLSTVSDPVRFFLDWGENLTLPTPDQLAANALSATEIQLTWAPVATNDLTQSVIVERWNGVAGVWNEIAVVAVTETNYLDSGLTPETNYRYRAAVTDINGNRSAYTAEVDATTRTVVPNYTVIDLTSAISGLLTNAAMRGNLLTNGVGLEHYDVRRTVALGAAHANAVLGSNAAPLFKAVAAFKQRWPQIQLDYDPALLSPQSILPRVGFLTGPGGSGVTVSTATAQMFDPNDPYQPVKAFVQEYSTLFGFGAEVFDDAMVQRDYVSAQTGARTVVWQQQVAGIPVFDALLSGHITADGELAGVACEFIPSPTQAVDPSVLSAVQGGYEFPVNGMQAVLTAVTNVGDDFGLGDFSTTSDSQGVTRNQSYTAAKGVKDTAHAELTWFPTSRNELKLAWQVIFTSSWRNEMYLTVISAVDNQVLFRRNLTADNAEASYRVYTSGSPAPMWPGLSTPGTTQAPLVDRTLVTLSAADATASPMGWLNDGGNVTVGNNVDAHLDRNDDNQSDLPYPTGAPADVFDFSLDLTGDPAGYGNAAVTQLFYWNNWMHDALYGLGFTEAAGNFQTDNYGRGGQGGDAVQADAQDGAGLNDGQHANNANMSTPPDGYAPRMQMYVFDGATPARDGCLDSSIVMHEYTHGLSSRLVGGGAGIDALQSAGMGEGWSDFYALALMVDPTSDPVGTYPLGAYATYHGFGTSFEQNYYYGIRHYPYCTDTNKNPLTLADIDPQHARIHLGVPRSPLMGTFSAAQASEVHNQGEVWCSMLWEVRAALVQKYGATAGNGLTLQLVTDGLKLTPANPNFVQARDAILLADRIYSGGTNAPEIWAAFAKRGLGYNARVPESATSTGTQEAGDLQPALAVEQVEIQTTSGTIELGGINPLSIHLRNLGNAPAKQVSAQLTTAVAGVSIAQNLSGYADIAVGDAGTNVLPFVLQTGSDYVSGTAIDLTLMLTSDQGVITNYLRLFAGQPGAEILLDNYSALADPVSQDSSPRDLTPWDLGNTEPLWLADNGSCLLKAGGKGKYILWKLDGSPQIIDNTNFMAHHMTRNGTVVGTLTLSNEVSVSSVTLSDAPYNGTVVTWTNIFPHTVGARWDFTGNVPVILTSEEYRWPKDAGVLSSAGNIYSSTLTDSFGQALYLTNTISYPKMQDVWDINANGVAVGAVSMQAGFARQALSFDSVGNMDWFTAVEQGLNAGQSDANLGTQISFFAQFTTAAQFNSPDLGTGAWRWLGPLNWQSTLSYANLINDAGMVAGVGAVYFNDATLDSMQPTHAFRMPTSGECQPFASIGIDLGVLTNGLHSFPRAMNAQGALVGYSDFDITNTGGLSTSQLNAHAVYWGVTNTTPEWLTNFPPSAKAIYGYADAMGINDSNQIVGVSVTADSRQVGVLWQQNSATNSDNSQTNLPFWEISELNERLTDTNWLVFNAVDINNNGLILAHAQHSIRDDQGNVIRTEIRSVLLVNPMIMTIRRMSDYSSQQNFAVQKLDGRIVPEDEEDTQGTIVQFVPTSNPDKIYVHVAQMSVPELPQVDKSKVKLKLVKTTPAVCPGQIRVYKDGVVFMDENQMEAELQFDDLSADWKIDAIQGGVVDLALLAQLPDGTLLTETNRINSIACKPANGRVIYVNPASENPKAPYDDLTKGAHTIREALAVMGADDNVLICPATYYEDALQVSSAGVIAGLAGKWLSAQPSNLDGPLANAFEYYYLPIIYGTSLDTGASLFRAIGGINGTRLAWAGLSFEHGKVKGAIQAPEYDSGGAIKLINIGAVAAEITCCNFENNKAFEFGGAIYLDSVANAKISVSQFENNKAEFDTSVQAYDKGMGGAIASIESALAVSDCCFYENQALVASEDGQSAPPKGSAGGGGDIYLKDGSLNLSQCFSTGARAGFKIENTQSQDPVDFTGDGGAILVHGQSKTGSKVVIKDSKFSGSKSYGNAGCIDFCYNSSPADRAMFDPRKKSDFLYPNDLGARCSGSVENVTFVDCKGGWQGGTVMANGRDINLTFSKCNFLNCFAGSSQVFDGKGGGIAVGGGFQGAIDLLGKANNNVTMLDCSFLGCSSSGNGGAIYNTIKGNLIIGGQTKILNCESKYDRNNSKDDLSQSHGLGGAAHCSAGGMLTLTDNTVVENNAASSQGGGVSVKSADLKLDGKVVIRGNKANGVAAKGYGNGGGIFVTTCFYDIDDDKAATIFSNDGTVVCDSKDVLVVGNTANRWGGGIYAGVPTPPLGADRFYGKCGARVVFDFLSVRANFAKSSINFNGDVYLPAQIATENVGLCVKSGQLELLSTTIAGDPKLDVGVFQFNSFNFDGAPNFVQDSLKINSIYTLTQ